MILSATGGRGHLLCAPAAVDRAGHFPSPSPPPGLPGTLSLSLTHSLSLSLVVSACAGAGALVARLLLRRGCAFQSFDKVAGTGWWTGCETGGGRSCGTGARRSVSFRSLFLCASLSFEPPRSLSLPLPTVSLLLMLTHFLTVYACMCVCISPLALPLSALRPHPLFRV